MIIECPNCESKVDAKVLAEHESVDEDTGPYKVSFLGCPICNNVMLGYQDYIQTGPDSYVWESAMRIWPSPEGHISGYIPDIVGKSLDEAEKCYKAKAF